jgi:antitoxin HicB
MKVQYTINIVPEEDGEGYYVTVPALPGCFSQGYTVEEAQKNIVEAIRLHLKCIKEEGEKIPYEKRSVLNTIVEVAI